MFWIVALTPPLYLIFCFPHHIWTIAFASVSVLFLFCVWIFPYVGFSLLLLNRVYVEVNENIYTYKYITISCYSTCHFSHRLRCISKFNIWYWYSQISSTFYIIFTIEYELFNWSWMDSPLVTTVANLALWRLKRCI